MNYQTCSCVAACKFCGYCCQNGHSPDCQPQTPQFFNVVRPTTTTTAPQR